MKSFKIITLGCKVNQCESESLGVALREADWWPAPEDWPAGLCIINTCTVTGKASMQSRQAVRQAVRANPGAFIVVTGCYAQTEAEALKKIEGVDFIVGHGDKHRIAEIVDVYLKDASTPRRFETDVDPAPEFQAMKTLSPMVLRRDVADARGFDPMPAAPNGNRTRPSLKIQDGCDAFCTYCIVPYARGRSRSMPLSEVMESIARLSAAGYREVVLSGIHLGCYGRDLEPSADLPTLLRRIDDEAVIDRVRLSSIEPLELSADIVDRVAASERFCPHFHVPLQSGDNGVLRRMHRPYTRDVFEKIVVRIDDEIPHAAIGADVLIGFPGESEAAFRNTYETVKNLPISYLHVFPFSARKGTPAARYPDPVPIDAIKDRCRRMRDLGSIKRKAFYRRFLGRTVTVLVENERDAETGLLKGMSSNYLKVMLEGGDGLKNCIVPVVVERVWPGKLVFGRLMNDLPPR
ncbi:MAG: tRNA (N(6)-L-threonylcarbamoyladenosine(37)-C(2))-methylthiotransferase MtaB [Desulfococcus multivorans]|uniref:tRNA (N(6)-L-threonylcarbamoyladenosine(37)-C(2))- methylthiotransferase MtaB n=1 Tax=Desulfococcus sp. TaxID=2025834 RepID=UPI002A3EB13F|nr:tRNA (N(6)-L-threonylcarbamoyladenosine(37)-C(2))-methylthiotransferase MtaB [Desulfococcus multivorans]